MMEIWFQKTDKGKSKGEKDRWETCGFVQGSFHRCNDNNLNTSNMPTLKRKLSPESSNLYKGMRSFPGDCTIVCKNGKVNAHRVVLCAASSFFMDSLSTVMSPGGCILCPQIDIGIMKLLIDFIYGMDLQVDFETMHQIIKVGKELGMQAFIEKA
ncbi:BTB domain-containing protein [Caerostris extrusa]|uniref:BTB domain-containing protein n=1 Tax=Caerostris extrusa TaxID=172846 RepID=A0AAV4MT66_CAEEX|nr:BTB domain-containing protein [Caerostris extrusa]